MSKAVLNNGKTVMDEKIVIETKDLKKYFKDVKAVDGISFKIKRGESVLVF